MLVLSALASAGIRMCVDALVVLFRLNCSIANVKLLWQSMSSKTLLYTMLLSFGFQLTVCENFFCNHAAPDALHGLTGLLILIINQI